MTRKQRARRIEIIKALSDLSRGGWANAKASDWEPLEAELRSLEKPIARAA